MGVTGKCEIGSETGAGGCMGFVDPDTVRSGERERERERETI